MSPTPIATTGPSSLRPIGFAQTLLTVDILLGLVCTTAVGLRMWQRARDRKFHVDDGLILLGLYAVAAWGTTVGIGTPDSSLAMPMLPSAGRAIYWLNITNVLALAFTKASICTTLLRINNRTHYRKTTWTLWLVMAALSISAAFALIYTFVQCKPNGRCKETVVNWHIVIYPVMGLFILVDIALAVIPIFVIHGLNMKRSLKLSTGAILALGGVACIASILCILPQVEVDDTGVDELYKIGSVVFWQNIETGLGIIASCLPTLRRLIKSFDTDHAGAITGVPPYYKADFSGSSGQTRSNNIEHMQSDSRLSPNRLSRHNMTLQLPRAIGRTSPQDSQRQRLRDDELG